MMKFKPNQTRTYDREGYKKRAACLCFRSEREDEKNSFLQTSPMHLAFPLESFLTNCNCLPTVEACKFGKAVGIRLSTTAGSFSLHSCLFRY